MSIHFSFMIKPKFSLFRKKTINFDEMVSTFRSLEKQEQVEIKVQGEEIRVQHCLEGVFWIRYKEKEGCFSGECQTHIAGPGFHVAAIHLLERACVRANVKLIVKDETGYYQHRDFKRMREEYFYPWLKHIMSLVCEQYSKSDYKFFWNLTTYSPKVIPGTVIMPIRRFTIDEIKEFYGQNPEIFAKEFFVWNEQQKDARFYRNHALLRMNTRCYFMFSERNIRDGIENALAIQDLEKALKLDYFLPFPKKEYRLLCRLHEQEAEGIEGVIDLEHDCQIGYRRQDVIHNLGQFTYHIFGGCLERIDKKKNTLFYYDDLPGNWHNIRITSFLYGSENAKFSEEMFLKYKVEEVLEFPVGDGNARLAIFEPTLLPNSPEGCYYEMTAQMILGNQMLLVNQTFCRVEEKSAVLNWFKQFSGKKKGSFS